MRSVLALLGLAFLTVAGCTPLDSGLDLGAPDGGRRDAGLDAGLEGSDASDAAEPLDAEPLDAGAPDAGGEQPLDCLRASGGPNPFQGRIFAATSYRLGAGNIYEITTGDVPTAFATVPAQGWLGPLLVTPDGRLLVATNENQGTVRDVSAGGTLIDRIGVVASRLFPSLGFVEGMAIDASGTLYVTNSERGVQPLATVSATGEVGRLPRSYDNATSVVVCGDVLLVAEGGTGRILRHDLTTGNDRVWASGFIAGEDSISAQMVVDRRGRVLILWSVVEDEPGLFDVTDGGDFAQTQPMVSASLFTISVNQLAVNAENDLFVAGADSGQVFVSRFDGAAHGPFMPFIAGLRYTDSLAIGPD